MGQTLRENPCTTKSLAFAGSMALARCYRDILEHDVSHNEANDHALMQQINENFTFLMGHQMKVD
jgi:hypothetical protein